VDGKCKDIGLRVFASDIGITVQSTLLPSDIGVQELRRLETERRHNGGPDWIQSPCLDLKWSSVRIILRYDVRNDKVRAMTIFLVKRMNVKQGFRLAETLKHLAFCLEQQWKVTVNGTAYPFKVDFQPFENTNITRQVLLPPRYAGNIVTDGQNAFRITRLFFCQQVSFSCDSGH